MPQALRGQGGVPGADAPARDQEARGRLGARGGQARGEGQPGEGGVHTGHQREVHLDAGEGPRELKPIRRAYEAWVEAGLPLDWDRQAFEAERKMDSKKHLAK